MRLRSICFMFFLAVMMIDSGHAIGNRRQGGNVSNGGSGISAQFTRVGAMIANHIDQDHVASSFPEFSTREFKIIVESAEVVEINRRCIDNTGVARVACNYPSLGKIEVYGAGFQSLSIDAQLALVFHEYLGLIEVEIGHYRISSRLSIEDMGQSVAENFTVVMGTREVARIQEKRSNRSLVYYVTNTENTPEMVFTIEETGVKREIKRLNLNVANSHIELYSPSQMYTMEIMNRGAISSYDGLRWCFVPTFTANTNGRQFDRTGEGLMSSYQPITPYKIPGLAMGLFIPVAAPTCTLAALTPTLVAAALAPIDGIITLLNRAFGNKARANHKIDRMIRGKSSKASPRVFQAIIDGVRSL